MSVSLVQAVYQKDGKWKYGYLSVGGPRLILRHCRDVMRVTDVSLVDNYISAKKFAPRIKRTGDGLCNELDVERIYLYDENINKKNCTNCALTCKSKGVISCSKYIGQYE